MPEHAPQSPDGGSLRERTSAATSEVVQQLDEVTGALESLAQALDTDGQLPVALQRCCGQATHALPDADFASITVVEGGEYRTVAATSDYIRDIDQAQYRSGQGPCLKAAETGRIVRAVVADIVKQWPEFGQAATAAQVRSSLSAPLFLDSEYHGSLNLYSYTSAAFGALDAKLLELYTTAAEAALGAEHRYLAARREIEQLRQALESRAVIDQAKGILMAVRHVDADTAFALLVQRSQRENRKLREVAAHFVADLTRRT